MMIRQETKNDYEKIYQLIEQAFETAEHRDGKEQDLVKALRNSDSFVPELSLVAEMDGGLAGHILFTEGRVGTDKILVLAPLSVSPRYQQRGVGSALMKAGHKVARELGYQYVLVLGSETYFPRAGYQPAESFGIEIPEGIPSANLMVLQLQEDARPIGGAVTYAKEFGM